MESSDPGFSDERNERLTALVAEFGGKAALGRKLGYRDGAFVGQMLRRERAISEKTILLVHALPGLDGWFGRVTPGAESSPSLPAPSFRESLQALAETLSATPDGEAKQSAVDLLSALIRNPALYADLLDLIEDRLTEAHDAGACAPGPSPRG